MEDNWVQRLSTSPDIPESISTKSRCVISLQFDSALEPVSYTHLDVYKRQDQTHVNQYCYSAVMLVFGVRQLGNNPDEMKGRRLLSAIDGATLNHPLLA